MNRVRLALIVVGGLVVVAGVALLLRGGGGEPEKRPQIPRTNDAKGLLTVAPTSQFDLARGTSVRVQVRADGVAELSGRLITAEGTSSTLGDGSVRDGDATLTLDGAARAAVGSCGTHWLEVTAKPTAGGVTRRVVRLAADPPRCGEFFAANSIWNQPLAADAPLDRQSSQWAKSLDQQVDAAYQRNFPPTLNTTRFSTPVYTVPAGQPRVRVALVGKRKQYGGRIQAVLDSVPIPEDAVPSIGTDAHMVVWQPATNTMWELFVARKSGGKWTAAWGGRMTDVTQADGFFSDSSGIQPGATATSLPLVGGLVTLADLRRGRIDHALAIAIPQSRAGVWARPAQRTDGFVRSDAAIPAGARFRLDPDVDVDALKAPRLTKMLAHAAQRYGIYVRDTSPTPTLYGEDPRPSGSRAWETFLAPSPGEVLRAFPWDRLEVTKADLFTYSNKPVAR